MAKTRKPSSQQIADAVLGEDAALLRTLLEKGGNANAVYYMPRGFTKPAFLRPLTSLEVEDAPVLVLAAMAGRADLVSLLLEHGADVDAPAIKRDYPHIVVDELMDMPRTNPLIVAARKGHLDVVRVLIEAGADVNPEMFMWDKTALKDAKRGGNQHIVELLKAHGAK